MMLDIKFNAAKSMRFQIGDCRLNTTINLMLDGKELY